MEVTFAFYRDVYRGRLEETDFERHLPGALADFNALTFQRVPAEADNPDFWLCVCNLVDFNRTVAGNMAGMATLMYDGVSGIHYSEGFNKAGEQAAIVRRWLAAYPELTYRGVG